MSEICRIEGWMLMLMYGEWSWGVELTVCCTVCMCVCVNGGCIVHAHVR